MKQTKNGIKMLVAAIVLLSVISVSSCNKEAKAPSESKIQNTNDNMDASRMASSPVAWWKFDSLWKESVQSLAGVPKSGAKFSRTAWAKAGKAAFQSGDKGFTTYASAGTALPNLTSALSVDFWIYATPKEGGAQCVFAIPQTGAFWPTHHVLLDGYNVAQGDTGLIKIMFKANKAIDYNERWFVFGGLPKFYNRWTHVQYAYDGATSQFTCKINGVTVMDHVLQYTDGTNTTLLGNLNPNPGSYGVVIGGWQNNLDPVLFGSPEPWMLGYKGLIDQLKIYNTLIF